MNLDKADVGARIQLQTVQMFTTLRHGLRFQPFPVVASVTVNPDYFVLTPGRRHTERHAVNDDQTESAGCPVENHLFTLNIRGLPG